MTWVVTEGINPHDHTPGWLLITALVESLQFAKSVQYIFLGTTFCVLISVAHFKIGTSMFPHVHDSGT